MEKTAVSFVYEFAKYLMFKQIDGHKKSPISYWASTGRNGIDDTIVLFGTANMGFFFETKKKADEILQYFVSS